jgi:FkbM family methyltransferase
MRRLVRSGDVVYDIGAHVGEHSVLLAQLVGPTGRVFAFEPNPERHHALRRTVAQYGNGELLPYAVGERAGTVVLYVPEFHVTASLANWTGGRVGAVREVRVPQRSIDELIDSGAIAPAHFVKCDVEGAELLAFRGAVHLLDRVDAPIVMYEANRAGAEAFGVALTAATEFLRELRAPNYSIHWVQPGGMLVPVDALRNDVDLFNLVAIPEHRRGATT